MKLFDIIWKGEKRAGHLAVIGDEIDSFSIACHCEYKLNKLNSVLFVENLNLVGGIMENPDDRSWSLMNNIKNGVTYFKYELAYSLALA